MARRSRLRNMVYDEVSFVDKGANLDLDGETGAHVVLFKRDTEDDSIDKGDMDPDDVHTPSPLNSKGKLNRRGEQVKCSECGCMFDKDKGSCPECGAANSKKSKLMKALSEFFGAVDDIEKDGGVDLQDAPADFDNDLELTPEELQDIDEALAGFDGSSISNGEADTLPDNNGNPKEGDMPDPGKKPDLTDLSPEVRQYIEGLEAAQVQKNDPGSDEEIFKGLSPEAVQIVKSAQDEAAKAHERIEKMEQEKEAGQYREVAKSLSNLSVEDKTGDALLVLAKADEGAYEEVMRVLKSADAELSESKLFSTLGKSFSSDSSSDAIETAATEIAKAEGITIEKARVKAFEQNSAEYEKTIGGNR
jgi:hypothetical protein